MSARFSTRDTESCPIFIFRATRTCVLRIALRRSCNDISSLISAAARASISARSAAGRPAITSRSVFAISTCLSAFASASREQSAGDAEAKALIRLFDEPFEERPLALPALVAGHQQDCLAPGVEGERDPPNAASGIEAQFLHVRVSRAVQRIDPWPLGGRTKLLDKPRLRQQLNPHLGFERRRLGLEFRRHEHGPGHRIIWLESHMMSSPYCSVGRRL